MRRRLPAAVVGLAAVLMTGCSMTAGGAGGGGGAGQNQADVEFSTMMIPHHRQSVVVSALALKRSQDEFVRHMATEITEKENAEIGRMSDWLRSWNVAVPVAGDHMSHAMPGMLSAAELQSLDESSGAAFDKTWTALLAKHLGHGVDMAKTVLSQGSHPETKELAQQIVTDQSAEITQLKSRLP
ncbi:DUF305 domain-containing protein [Amycolatopsis sp. NPDC059027]|uniref:DUF305 domain-containing protein n=1 Tax=unclassified Amycolatopsis TaxID=2618356 RepID=UPI00366D5CA5